MKHVMLSNEEDDILMTEIDFLQQKKIGLSVDRAGTLMTVCAYVILYESICNKT